MACDESFGKIQTDKLIYSPIVICKQTLDVQTYGTSCLFSLVCSTVQGSDGDHDWLETGAMAGEVFAFSGH